MQFQDFEGLPLALCEMLEELLRAGMVLHLPQVRAVCLQLLTQQVAGWVAGVEAVREIDMAEVWTHGDCAGEVGLAHLACHVRQFEELDQ